MEKRKAEKRDWNPTAAKCALGMEEIMNELMITLLENDWLLYAACGAAGAGCLIQIILSVIYNRSLNASERMRSTKILWLRQMKTRYESGCEWDNRIRNVELFVDKNIGRRKWMGVYLKTWEALSRMLLSFVIVLSVLGALGAIAYVKDESMSGVYLVTGAVLALGLRGISVLANLKEKQNLLRTNLCDYFENTLQGETKYRRRETSEEREAYVGVQKQREEMACAVAGAERIKEKEVSTGQKEKAMPDETAMADGMQANNRTVQEKADNKKPLQQDKRDKKLERLAKKEAKRLNNQEKERVGEAAKQQRKQAKEALKLQRKQAKEALKLQRKQAKEQKRREKLTKRMEKMQLQLSIAATAEHAGLPNGIGGKKEESARLKREQLKRKVDVTPAQEDQILSDVLREFLA